MAICDQVEQKDRAGGNAYKLLKRRVVQLVTPGKSNAILLGGCFRLKQSVDAQGLS